VRVAEVLRERLGLAEGSHLDDPRTWTRERRQKAAQLLGETVEELFPPEDEADLDKLTLEMRLAGYRQRGLAREMGISEGYLSYMRSGKRRWTRKMKERAAAVLEMPVEELFEESRDGGDGAGRQRALPGL
jgi:hypothetical protein